MTRRVLPLIMSVLLLAVPGWAQDEDLAPLTPAPKAKPRPKVAKPKPKPAVKPAAADEELAPLTPVGKSELWVKLSGEVQGARLLIDGREVGVLPLGAQAVSAGEHQVQVKRPGFANFNKKVTVGAGKTVEVAAALQASAAVLDVTSDAGSAQVLINGKPVGATPLEDFEVPAGAVVVVVRKDGYADARQDLTVRAGKDYPLAMKLEPLVSGAVAAAQSDSPRVASLTPDEQVSSSPLSTETQVESAPPITSRWYFWVGLVAVAGAVAAGTAVGVSAANTPKPLTQQDICGGPCDACINCSAALKF